MLQGTWTTFYITVLAIVLGTVLGVILLAELNTAIAIIGLSGQWQQTIYGLVIILAVLLDKFYRSVMARQVEVVRA